jgi:hypothetical protein
VLIEGRVEVHEAPGFCLPSYPRRTLGMSGGTVWGS